MMEIPLLSWRNFFHETSCHGPQCVFEPNLIYMNLQFNAVMHHMLHNTLHAAGFVKSKHVFFLRAHTFATLLT